MVEITQDPIVPEEALRRVALRDSGSVVLHVGIVKPRVQGRATRGMRLTADGDVKAELKRIEDHVRSDSAVLDVYIVRRLGDLAVGDVVLAVAVAAVTRESAFSACREAVEQLKEKRALHKEEQFET